MHSAWVAFASSGDPGWTVWDPEKRTVQVFGIPSSLQLDPRAEELAALDNAGS